MTAAQLTDTVITWQTAKDVGSVAGGTAFLTWFIFDQFRRLRSLIYRIISAHNREDDDRFESLSTDNWNLRLELARRLGGKIPERKTFPRRRYLQEDNEGSKGGNVD